MLAHFASCQLRTKCFYIMKIIFSSNVWRIIQTVEVLLKSLLFWKQIPMTSACRQFKIFLAFFLCLALNSPSLTKSKDLLPYLQQPATCSMISGRYVFVFSSHLNLWLTSSFSSYCQISVSISHPFRASHIFRPSRPPLFSHFSNVWLSSCLCSYLHPGYFLPLGFKHWTRICVCKYTEAIFSC